jgi:hypothetical protein
VVEIVTLALCDTCEIKNLVSSITLNVLHKSIELCKNLHFYSTTISKC